MESLPESQKDTENQAILHEEECKNICESSCSPICSFAGDKDRKDEPASWGHSLIQSCDPHQREHYVNPRRIWIYWLKANVQLFWLRWNWVSVRSIDKSVYASGSLRFMEAVHERITVWHKFHYWREWLWESISRDIYRSSFAVG